MVQIWIIYWNGLGTKKSKHFRDTEFFFFKGYRIYLIKNNVPDLGIFLNHYNLGKKIYQSMIDT